MLSAMDVLLAVVCAANGSLYFIYFGVLAFLMYVHGMYFKSRVEKGE
jgi:hypothetical protein